MMKKLFSLVLCLCMALSLTGAVAQEWDAAYDVVVIGFGGAGASAAIEAADAGAKVLVLEKAPATAAGGNTKLSGQQVLSPTDVEAALAYETASDAERDYAETLGATAQFTGTRQCVYCNHCLPCPVGIDVAAVNRALDGILAGAAETHAAIREQYAALAAHGSDCIACGNCDSRCPFGVPTIQRMAKAADVFGR